MVLFLVPLSIIVLYIAYKIYENSRLLLPPGPSPWLIIGSFHAIEPMRYWSFAKWSKVYGPIISVWTGSTMNVIVSKSKLAKRVFKDDSLVLAPADKYANKSTNVFKRLLWVEYGPNYFNFSKVCTFEFFSPKNLAGIRAIRENEFKAMVESIYKDSLDNVGNGLTLRKYLASMGFNIFTGLVLGKRFVTKEGEMDEQGAELLAIIAEKMKIRMPFELEKHFTWLTWMMISPERVANRELETRQNRIMKTIIRDTSAASKSESNNDRNKRCFVDVLVNLSEKYQISERDQIRLLWEVITAGMDTATVTVEWAMVQMIKNPVLQAKAQKELDQVIGLDRVLSDSDLSKLSYLNCVAKEALRLHPPTSLMLPHKAIARTKIGGYDIPKGTKVNVNAWAIARDSAVWPRPSEFRPERFIEEEIDAMGKDNRLLPFGKGTHICPAAQLGMDIVMSTLGHLLHHFKWGAAKGLPAEDIDMTESPGSVTFMATPLQVVATMRLPPHMYQHLNALSS